MVGLALLDIGLLVLLISMRITALSFLWGVLLLVSFPALASIAYVTSSLSAGRYHVAGDALVIEWGRFRQVVPLSQIRAQIPGEEMGEIREFRGVRWPGCFVGVGRVVPPDHDASAGYKTLFFATRPPAHQLLLVAEEICVAISPDDLENFKVCLEAIQATGMVAGETPPLSDLGFLQWRIWGDRPALLTLAAAVLLNTALFATLCTIYGRLPAQVPLHFDRFGVVDRLAAPANLFVLPLAGFLAWLLNGMLGWYFYQEREERPLALILWGAAAVLQAATWTAVLGLLAQVTLG